MGCDIHGPWIEVRIGERWEHVAAFTIAADYQLFAKLASVRVNEHRPAMFAPRGLPYDLSWRTESLVNAIPEGHNASWLTEGEIDAVLRSYDTTPQTHFPPLAFVAMAACMQAIMARGLLCRAVFGFDN